MTRRPHAFVARTDRLLSRLRGGEDPTLVNYGRKRTVLKELRGGRTLTIREGMTLLGTLESLTSRILAEMYAEGLLRRTSVMTKRHRHYVYRISTWGLECFDKSSI